MIFFQFCIKNLGLFQIKKVKTQLNREKNHSYLIANLFYRIILNSKMFTQARSWLRLPILWHLLTVVCHLADTFFFLGRKRLYTNIWREKSLTNQVRKNLCSSIKRIRRTVNKMSDDFHLNGKWIKMKFYPITNFVVEF